MKTIINRMSMRFKFACVLVLPLLALAWFAAQGIMERLTTLQEFDRLHAMTQLAQRAGDTVHQMQLERGMTAGFLGSEGNAFGDQLKQQRPNTDAAVQTFQTQRNALDPALLTPAVQQRLNEIDDQWQRQAALRKRVDDLDIAMGDALSHYTGINGQLMAFVGTLSHLTSEGGIARQLSAYYQLLEAKDLAGIERALLSNAFASDGMPDATLRRFLSLLGEEQAFLASFRLLAGEESRDQLDQALSGAEIERLLARRELAISQAQTGGYGVDPEQWFEWQTVKIARLKALENHVADTVVAQTVGLRESAQQALWQYAVIALVASLMAIIAAVLIVRAITQSLNQALTSIATRGSDLTQRLVVPGSDELSQLYQAFNESSEVTEALVADVKRNAQSVAVASNQMAQGNQDLAQRTEEQSASLVQTASSMEQITATVRQSAENAQQAQQMTGDVAQEAKEATAVASQAQTAMQLILQANEQVTSIVATIDNIAFQTNLLALNASVEAARAGEHGRGFAVVADEVRKLASRSAQEASQIRQLIDNNVAKISEGESLVTTTNETLGRIAQRVGQMASLMDEMASATHEQSAGIEQINRAMAQLEDVTQQNAALVEEMAAASRSLDDQADDMTSKVSDYLVRDIEPAASRLTMSYA
ncbi:methyl-accepting chemotaxis protein [Vreelandella neptunia]|uniref:Nitrate- and nitrite sensing domain-containing protein n=1 Tax=Vreelandella neptunia TaxID=115551 RepID=A0ABZ0YPH2_9GAMM|nr:MULTISPECIES: methyl-accepting chemotaxis protein [Halomonas]MBF57888.1 chemotaxis protein [Halomonas sp.]MDN3560848.1 nitrate- and nitrite sensing domain-containing protein [Halomonas neptunia]TDV97434.1 methyl-accepting chemotaxis protein [Halomonas alkaliantarctica]WQH13160.1 nitrate- and nitrite sensing domain-containing protein [Halomonas neptunia]